MSMVDDTDRRKADFVSAYKLLCKHHGMMVTYLEIKGYFSAFATSVRSYPEAIEEQALEMLINDTAIYKGKTNDE